tara:strand:- start:5526 stop:6014 length:489 start_codon:yes stop_codon:yes gene_type:complete
LTFKKVLFQLLKKNININYINMGIFKDCGCGCGGLKQQEKLITSIISGLTFFVIANPETFRLMRSILGSRIATPTGCPSTGGLILHSFVFILVVWGMMNIKKKKQSGCGCGGKKEGSTCGGKKGEKKVKSMSETPNPEPEFVEEETKPLGSMDISPEGTMFH